MPGGEAGAGPNGWNEWGNHVLLELKNLNGRLSKIEESQIKLLLQVEGLKVRASIFGAIGGAGTLLVLQVIGKYLVASLVTGGG